MDRTLDPFLSAALCVGLELGGPGSATVMYVRDDDSPGTALREVRRLGRYEPGGLPSGLDNTVIDPGVFRSRHEMIETRLAITGPHSPATFIGLRFPTFVLVVVSPDLVPASAVTVVRDTLTEATQRQLGSRHSTALTAAERASPAA